MSETRQVRVVLTTTTGVVTDAAWAADEATVVLETTGLDVDTVALQPADVQAATPDGDLITAERLRAARTPGDGIPILVAGFPAHQLGVPADVELPAHLLSLKYPTVDGAAPAGWLCKIYDFEWCD
ncbi:MAG: hypothetical protein V9G19_04105 [Tetrasphaera sp.]